MTSKPNKQRYGYFQKPIDARSLCNGAGQFPKMLYLVPAQPILMFGPHNELRPDATNTIERRAATEVRFC